MSLTVLSLSWTTWSIVSKFSTDSARASEGSSNYIEAPPQSTSTATTGASKAAVKYSDVVPPQRAGKREEDEAINTKERRELFAQISLVYLLISAYYAMVLLARIGTMKINLKYLNESGTNELGDRAKQF